jgi:hypothetical protein
VLLVVDLLILSSALFALDENIDPYDDDSHYASDKTIGWLNAEPLDDSGPEWRWRTSSSQGDNI